jgi:Lon protease-like protein
LSDPTLSTSDGQQALPIFPLSTVLFPDGILPLRIFEARYVDMVRACMRHDTPFGVCRLIKGSEGGAPAEHEAIGCLAHLRDWDMQPGGLLHVRAQGGRRFHITARRVAPDGLILADVQLIDADPLVSVPPEHAACTDLIRRIVDTLRREGPEADQGLIAEPCAFESAAWVANRLSEFLPIAAPAKHQLMALDDPLARLAIVHRWLLQNKVI